MATWTADDVATLKKAVASGVMIVTYSGPPSRTVQYQNLREMRALLADMERDVRGTPSYRRVRFKKGFRDG